MKVQANSFRLPVLRLQPRDVSKHFSQEPIDYNQSNSSIKYQSSPLRDGAPIKKRVRGMTIAIYNSQEKLKTSEYRYNNQPSEFITQSQHNINNNSTSALNTVRRYRSKLKQMMYGVDTKIHPEELSRDPRIYSFKEPAATIRLTKLNEIPKEDSMAFKERVKMLMAKIQMLLQSQSFYQAPKAQESFKVTLVKLRDEYDCLYEDFNDFYVTKKQLDQQVLGLLNHMEIIKKLLKPAERKQVILSKPQSKANFQIERESTVEEVPIEKSESESIIVLESMDSQPSRKPSSVIYEPHVDTPISSTLFRGEETQSEFSETNPLGEVSDQSPGMSPKRRNKSKTKIDRTPKSELQLQLQSVQSNSRKNIQSNYNDDNLDDYNDPEQSLRLISNRRSSRQTSHQASTIQDEPEQIVVEETVVEESNRKSPLKRTVSNMSSVSKRRSTVILGNESKKQGKKKRSGARTISERDDSQFDSDEYDQEDQENQVNDSKIDEEEKEIVEESNTLLDKLLSTANIYDWQYFQKWEYHIDQIIDGKLFGEYDL